MAEKKDHVIVRDGSARLGGPRPDPPKRPYKEPAEAEAGTEQFGGGYTDRSTVGVYDARKAFENAHGFAGPRGPDGKVEGKHDHLEPGGAVKDGVPVPTD